MCDTAKFGKMLEDMPDEVREYLEQHCPGPWMLFGMWEHGPWADEEMPDEVKQWFRQHFGRRFKGQHFCPPSPWMFWHRPWRHRPGHCAPPGPWSFGHAPWADEEMPDEVKQWFHERFGDWSKGCPPWAQKPPESSTEEASPDTAG